MRPCRKIRDRRSLGLGQLLQHKQLRRAERGRSLSGARRQPQPPLEPSDSGQYTGSLQCVGSHIL